MSYRLAADGVLLLHLAFTLFAVLGGLLVLRRPSLLWWHLGTVLWGAVIEWADRLGKDLPAEYLKVELRHKNLNERIVQFSARGPRYDKVVRKVQKQ